MRERTSTMVGASQFERGDVKNRKLSCKKNSMVFFVRDVKSFHNVV